MPKQYIPRLKRCVRTVAQNVSNAIFCYILLTWIGRPKQTLKNLRPRAKIPPLKFERKFRHYRQENFGLSLKPLRQGTQGRMNTHIALSTIKYGNSLRRICMKALAVPLNIIYEDENTPHNVHASLLYFRIILFGGSADEHDTEAN